MTTPLEIPRREIVTAPASEPVTVDEVKTHLRLEDSDHDAYITELIKAIRLEFEGLTGLALITQTWRCWYEGPAFADNLGWWNGVREGALEIRSTDFLTLRPNPVSSITSVTTYDPDHAGTAYSSDNYSLDAISRPARLVLDRDAIWPSNLRDRNSIAVVVIAGYGAASAVPSDIKHILKMAIAHRFEHRGELLSGEAELASRRIFGGLVQRYRTRFF